MVPLQDILAAGRLKFLDLLGTKLSAAVAEAISRDKQAGCCLRLHYIVRRAIACDFLWRLH